MSGVPYYTWKEVEESFNRARLRNPYYAEMYRDIEETYRVRRMELQQSFEFGTAEFNRFNHEFVLPLLKEMSRLDRMIRCTHPHKYLDDDGNCRKCGAEAWRNISVSHASTVAPIPL